MKHPFNLILCNIYYYKNRVDQKKLQLPDDDDDDINCSNKVSYDGLKLP